MYKLFGLYRSCNGMCCLGSFFFFQAEDGIRDLYVTGVQTCALPILDNDIRHAPTLFCGGYARCCVMPCVSWRRSISPLLPLFRAGCPHRSSVKRSLRRLDRKSTRLNSSHVEISYAVFCLKKKNNSSY